MKKNFVLRISLLVLMCGLVSISCATTQDSSPNELEGTTWAVIGGEFTGTTILFTGTNSITMNIQLIVATGTYLKNNEMYSFQFKDGTRGEGHYRNNRQLELNGETFILQSGDDSGDWNGTVWQVEFSTKNSILLFDAWVLTLTNGECMVKNVTKTQGTYRLKNKKVSYNFPDVKGNGNIVDNTITLGRLKFVKQ